jgi:hypothetical protein
VRLVTSGWSATWSSCRPVFLLGFGEELWKRYLPKYLEALGAGVGIVGLFGTTKDLVIIP